MIDPTLAAEADVLEQKVILCSQEEAAEQIKQVLGSAFAGDFSGEEQESCLYYADDLQLVFLGLGKHSDYAQIKWAARQFSFSLRKKWRSGTTSFIFPSDFGADQKEAFFLGFLLGSYQIRPREEELHFLRQKSTKLLITQADLKSYKTALSLSQGMLLCQEWLDKGNNQKTPQLLKSFLQDWCAELGLELQILNRDEAHKAGLHAFLAVNQGSAHEACFAIINYKHPNARKTIALVGKCITFDTGGISIKSSTNLHYMKSDMGGATAVLGLLQTLVAEQLPIGVTAILPITDNAVSAQAYVPSDVIFSHAGKSIEVIDTDAEGRMTLADGLSYAIQNFKPDTIIDLATLTGSAVRTFGDACAALFSNNETLTSTIREAGDHCGDRIWPLPLWTGYRKNLQSDVADIKNYSGKPISGAIDAAIFLKEFIHDHPAWAHLDIAGVAFGSTPFAKGKSATGYGVHLLFEVLRRLAHVSS